MNFELISDYKPTGDQPQAIKELVEGVKQNLPYQTLLGVTGSGKTFTIAKKYFQRLKITCSCRAQKHFQSQRFI